MVSKREQKSKAKENRKAKKTQQGEFQQLAASKVNSGAEGKWQKARKKL